MRWPRRRKAPEVSLEKSEAVQAAREAQHRLTETKAQWPEVRALAARLAYIRERNHLSEAIEAAVLGGRDK